MGNLSSAPIILGLISDNNETNREEVQHLGQFCLDHNLVLNTKKYKRGHYGFKEVQVHSIAISFYRWSRGGEGGIPEIPGNSHNRRLDIDAEQ